ncbi:uncharacterized protein taf1c [Tautogolabrus adspersus]
MDYQFPQQLFPSFYNGGPPDSVLKLRAESWGCYDRVRPQGGAGPLSSWTFTPRHQVKGETWRHTEPVPIPLLSPRKSVLWPLTPPNPLDFREHMQNFFMDHCQDAFGCTSELLGEHFYFKHGRKERYRKDSVHMWKVKKFLDLMNLKICQKSYYSETLDTYNALLSDVVHSVPPDLLGDLLHEELTEQRDQLLFSEGATGGALAFVPFSQSCSDSQHGCLIYPRNQGLDCLNFHRVELQNLNGGSSCVNTSSPSSFQLKGPVRQISSASLLNQSCVAVRSDYLCGVWRLSETNEPRLLQVINTKEVATCISVSPHVLGEVLVASESGVVNLWTVGRGMQKVWEEDGNLYFNAKSAWRWCEFSAHPRVMLCADRTGVELTDIRGSPTVGHTLFRISNTSECRSGERLILSKYLGDAHCFHHLVTTQYSAYIMDERFPGVPMLKWDHYMKAPPMFCHVIPGADSSESAVGGTVTTKVLLGSHSSQEITLLQYSGGRAEACSSHGPPQSLLRPRDSLTHLPVQIPHRFEIATNRLSSPAAGLTCIQMKGGKEAGAEERLCILQLTEAGDIFYQILEPEQSDISPSPAAEDEPLPNKLPQPLKEATTPGRKTAADSKLVVSETSSDEDVIEPTQAPTVRMFVNETPERKQQESSDSSNEDSLSAGRRNRKLRQLKLQVVVNDSEPDQRNGFDKEAEEGQSGENNLEKPKSITETVGSSSLSHDGQTRVKLSDKALVKWKHWLMKLMQKNCKKKPRPHCLQHLTVQTEGILQPPDNQERDSAEQERIQSLRRDLRACMSRRSLLVHSAVSDSITAPDIKPVPDPVDTDAFRDQLSQRLTLSWQGEEAWRAWWEDSLGLNREKKVESLRRKRRREKEARRASGQRWELSGSFASSTSYQSELSDFSDSQGWASAASQDALSDMESIKSQSVGIKESGTPRDATPSVEQTDSPVPATPQSVRDKPDEQQTPSSSLTLTQPQTPRLNSILQTDGLVPATPESVRDKPDEQQTPSSSRTLTQPQTLRLNSVLQTDGPVPATPESVRDKPDEQRTPSSSRTLTQPQTPYSILRTESPVPATPRSVRDKPDEQRTPSSSRTLTQPQTPRLNSILTSQRKNKRPAEDILNSLFAPQPSQNDSFYLEEGSSLHRAPPPVASSSQLHGSQSLSQRSFRTNLSQDSSTWSQPRSFSQSSQGRLGLSQASQPKKKKSRMGF